MQRRYLPRWAVFLLLFGAYQIPEGVGARLLGSPALQAVLLLLFFPIAWALARARGYRGFEAYAMERQLGWARNLGLALLLAILAKAGAVAAGLSLGVYALESVDLSPLQVIVAVLGVIFVTFWPSVAEDILARGFWFRQVPELGHGTLFVLFTSAYYVLNHIYRLQAGPTEWLMLFAFGLAYAGALIRSGSLWAAIGLHWGWNIAAFASSDVLGVVTLQQSVSPLLSASAHLLALGVILLVSHRQGKHGPAPVSIQADAPTATPRIIGGT